MNELKEVRYDDGQLCYRVNYKDGKPDGLYEEWLNYKATVTNSPNTIKRHKQHYRKYLEASVLHEMKIKKIDELVSFTKKVNHQ